jgi:hypothetical protein
MVHVDGVDSTSVGCGNCGHVFDDFEAASAVDDNGNHLLSCPGCGSLTRHYSISVSDTAVIRESVKYKAKHQGDKKPFQEGVAGVSHFKATDEWHDVQRTIDRTNNWYDEVVRGPNGEVIREVHEPLTEHVGRGAAKGMVANDPAEAQGMDRDE